jgi:PIN domain nuclease of toxin-antitoxin system
VIVLDTHAWLWWLSDPSRLSDPAREKIAQTPEIAISTISIWELATLVRRGRLELDRPVGDWVARALSDARSSAVAPSPEIALSAAGLDERSFPGDPADRLIFASAQALKAPLITRDAAMRAFDSSATLW